MYIYFNIIKHIILLLNSLLVELRYCQENCLFSSEKCKKQKFLKKLLVNKLFFYFKSLIAKKY